MTDVDRVLSESTENYLETILLLVQKSPVARARDIALRLKVNRSSVSGALHDLSGRGLINYEPYGFVTLTPEGTEIATRILRRHEALRDFFVNVLGIDRAEADEAACRMEHGVSKAIIDRLLDLSTFMETCPKVGEKQARGDGYRCREAAHSLEKCELCVSRCLENVKNRVGKGDSNKMSVTVLSELKPGEKGRIEKLAGAGAIRRRIADMGVIKGSLVEVIRVAPMGDPIDVKIRGYHLTLRKTEAADICVQKVV